METQRVQIKGVLLWLVRWGCAADTRDFCPAFAALVDPVQNLFFLTVHYFNSLVPIAQQAGQAAVLGRLSVSKCLWCGPPEIFQNILFFHGLKGTVRMKVIFLRFINSIRISFYVR